MVTNENANKNNIGNDKNYYRIIRRKRRTQSGERMKFTRDEIIQRAIDINCELLRKTNFNSNNLDYHAHAYIDRLIHYDCENYIEVPKPTGRKQWLQQESEVLDV